MNREKAEELLYKQLELLAEQSKEAVAEELPDMTSAMCDIFELLFCEY